MGDGCLLKRDALQLLHFTSNLQTGGGGSLEVQEFKAIWKDTFGEDYRKITAPVLTRWWTVGAAANLIIRDWDKWQTIAQKICNAFLAASSANQCASALTSLMKETELKAHIAFIDGFHQS